MFWRGNSNLYNAPESVKNDRPIPAVFRSSLASFKVGLEIRLRGWPERGGERGSAVQPADGHEREREREEKGQT